MCATRRPFFALSGNKQQARRKLKPIGKRVRDIKLSENTVPESNVLESKQSFEKSMSELQRIDNINRWMGVALILLVMACRVRISE